MSKNLPAINVAPHDSLTNYLSYIQQFPVLSVEQEKALVQDLHNEENLEAARKLILSNLRFVVYIAKGYAGYGLPQADLIQEGNIGLMKAVKRFNPEVGVRLISFAVHWIKAEIHEYILRNWRIVKIATTKAQRKLFFNLRKMRKRLGWSTESEINNVAEELGVTTKEVRDMEARLNTNDVSFDPSPDDSEHDHHSPMHYLEDKSADPAKIFENIRNSEENQTQLYKAFQELDERSLNILQTRWLSEPKATLHELAEKYKVSAERIRQIEQQAFTKIKKQLLAQKN